MKQPQRRLSPDEAALWARVASTVSPLRAAFAPLPAEVAVQRVDAGAVPQSATPPRFVKPKRPSSAHNASPPPVGEDAKRRPQPRTLDRHGLDASWDRKLAQGIVQPDFSLDLHGHTLDAAHARLDHGLMQAQAQGARIVLLVTGRMRPSDDHGTSGSGGRSERRGAIRAKFLDWLASGPHASRIAAVRPAHPRHGGAGAVYIVLKRPR